MQWFLVRLFIELSFLGPLLEAFPGCRGPGDILSTFESFDELKKRGVIAGTLIVVSAVVEIGTAIWKVAYGTRSRRHGSKLVRMKLIQDKHVGNSENLPT